MSLYCDIPTLINGLKYVSGVMETIVVTYIHIIRATDWQINKTGNISIT